MSKSQPTSRSSGFADPITRTKPTEEELQEKAKQILPSAAEIADTLARFRYSGSQLEDAFFEVLKRGIQETLAYTAGDYVIEHLARLLPAAVDRVLESEWDAHANGKRVKETLRTCVLRKLEESVQRDIAAKYEIDVSVTFRRKSL